MTYNKLDRESHGDKEQKQSRRTILIATSALLFVVCMLCIAFSKQLFPKERETDPYVHEVHNPDIAQMSVQALEEVATVAKLESDRDDALFLLLRTYKRRSIFDLYSFYEKHPGNRFTDEALALAMHRSDSLYEAACRINTEQGWSDFVVKVPEPLQRDGMDRYDAFRWERTAELWDTEEKAWEQTTLLHSYEAFRRYTKMYPHGEHAGEAKANIARIQRDNERRSRRHEIDEKKYRKWLKERR